MDGGWRLLIDLDDRARAEVYDAPEHQCNVYCRDGAHALVCWVSTNLPEGPSLDFVRRAYVHLGGEVLDVRPAPEAMPEPAVAAHVVGCNAYLVVVRGRR